MVAIIASRLRAFGLVVLSGVLMAACGGGGTDNTGSTGSTGSTGLRTDRSSVERLNCAD